MGVRSRCGLPDRNGGFYVRGTGSEGQQIQAENVTPDEERGLEILL